MKKRILLLGLLAFLVCMMNNIAYAQDYDDDEYIDDWLFNEPEDVEPEDVEPEDVDPPDIEPEDVASPIVEEENNETQESEWPNENSDETDLATSLEQTSPVENSTDDSEDSSNKDEDNKDSSKDENDQDSSDENDQNSSDEKDDQDSSEKNEENSVPGSTDTVSSDVAEDDIVPETTSPDNENTIQEVGGNNENTIQETGDNSENSIQENNEETVQEASGNSENIIQEAGDNSENTIEETGDNSENTIEETGGNSEDIFQKADGDKAANDNNTIPSSEETTQNTENTTVDTDDSSQEDENTTLNNDEASSDEVVSNAANQPIHWVKSPPGRRVIIVYLHANPNYTHTTTVKIIYQSKHGEVKINYNDTLSYIPNDPEFVGEDSLTYRFNDQQGKEYRSTVKIVINKKGGDESVVNRADGQLAHTATTEQGVPLIINIGANYKPNAQQTLTLNSSENSQVIDNKDGTLTYFPNQEFISGIDTFSYTTTNAVGQAKTFIIQVEVGDAFFDVPSAGLSSPYQGNNDVQSAGFSSVNTYQTELVTFYYIDPFITNYAEISTSYSRKKHQLTLIHSVNSQITLNWDGTITYIANPGFEGVDIFYYELFDKRTQITTTFTVNVTVTEETKTPPVACNTIYIVHDESASDSQLLTVDDPLGADNTAKTLGPIYNGLDLEGLAIDPNTKRLYAASGSGSSSNLDGYLFLVNPKTGSLKVVGDTGYSELVSLAFHPDGTLWAGTGGEKINPEGPGLIQIDPKTAKVLYFEASPWNDPKRKMEGLTWASIDLVWGTSDEVLYATENHDLWAFHGKKYQMKKLCNNLPGEVEALETLSGGLLLFAIDNNKGNTIHVYNPVQCEELDLGLESVVAQGKGHRLFETAIEYEDIEAIAWTSECQPKMDLPSPVVVKKDKKDNQSSTKKDDSKSSAKKDDSKSSAKKDNSKSSAKKDDKPKKDDSKDNKKSSDKK